jgi:hypothetical protein
MLFKGPSCLSNAFIKKKYVSKVFVGALIIFPIGKPLENYLKKYFASVGF